MSGEKDIFLNKVFSGAELEEMLALSRHFIELYKSAPNIESTAFLLYSCIIKYCVYILAKKNIGIAEGFNSYSKLIEKAAHAAHNDDIEALGKKALNDYNEIVLQTRNDVRLNELNLIASHFEKLME